MLSYFILLSLAPRNTKKGNFSLVVFINPCLSVSWVELMRSMCSKCGLTWLFLGKRKPLMSELLMRNYQKLIKIKKGPKVKDLLITVPCKSCIIRSLQSWPNTVEKNWEDASQDCTVQCQSWTARRANWRIGQAGLLLVNR